MPAPKRALLVAALSLGSSACTSPAAPVVATPTPEAPPVPAPAGVRAAEASDGELAWVQRARLAVLLKDGRVLAAGGDPRAGATNQAQLFDPKTRAWAATAPLGTARHLHALAALADGGALACGGDDARPAPNGVTVPGRPLATCEIFDAKAGVWAPAPPMHAPRARFTLTTLTDGRVLAVGDPGSEVFDPAKGAWGDAIPTSLPFVAHGAALLADGRVLVIGAGGQPIKGAAETFDPKAGAWTVEPPPPQALHDASVTVLLDGSVLLVGGAPAGAVVQQGLTFAAVFEPKRQRWNVTGQPHVPHMRHGALALPNGDVLVAGGDRAEPELYRREVWVDVPTDLAARLDLVRPADEARAGPGK